jgi:hypothetical protein
MYTTSFACCASNSVIFHSFMHFFLHSHSSLYVIFSAKCWVWGALSRVSFPQKFAVMLRSPYYRNDNSVYVQFNVPCDKWVPFTTALYVVRLQIEERPPIWRVAETILNKLQTVDKGWSSSLGAGWGANNSSPLKCIFLQNIHGQNPRPGLILWYDISNKRGTWDLVLGMLGAV